MKRHTLIAIGLFAILSSAVISTNAQSFNEPAIKILPTANKGILKVLYAYDKDNSNQPVTVKFFNNEGVLTSDVVNQETFQSGFLKKYDINLMASKTFWIEVKSANVTAVYKLTESNDGSSFVPSLESTTSTHQLVAANN